MIVRLASRCRAVRIECAAPDAFAILSCRRFYETREELKSLRNRGFMGRMVPEDEPHGETRAVGQLRVCQRSRYTSMHRIVYTVTINKELLRACVPAKFSRPFFAFRSEKSLSNSSLLSSRIVLGSRSRIVRFLDTKRSRCSRFLVIIIKSLELWS